MTSDKISQMLRRDDIDVLDQQGKVLHFSLRRFIDDIAHGNLCFICGADEKTKVFNNEHVIPDWILSKCNLHNRRIAGPNLAGLRYEQYTIPCCADCNAGLARTFETPISSLLKQGYQAIKNHLADNGPWRIFAWLSLIYLKTHLKDSQLRFHLDHREGTEKIGDLYDWKDLHHIHCVARSFYSGAQMRPEVLGSILLCKARFIQGEEAFDYVDLYRQRTMLLRVGEVALVGVLNDSGGVQSRLRGFAQRLTGPLSSLQLRELMTHMAVCNMDLTDRPSFESQFERIYYNPKMPQIAISDGAYVISADVPTASFRERDPKTFGELLAFAVKDLIPVADRESLLTKIKSGRHSFILDNETFLVNPKEP